MTLTSEEINFEWPLLCPVCREDLVLQTRALICTNGHSFDRAKEGYANLLRLKKRPKFMGDAKEMLQARAAFLAQGDYAPLMNAISQMIGDHVCRHVVAQVDQKAANERPVEPQIPFALFDVGCGEGSYAAFVASAQKRPVRVIGMDLAKDAARMAAKRYPSGFFFVADVNQPLLLADGSVDVILNVFAPRNPPDFARILRNDGLLLTVIPGADHLATLRTHLDLLEIQADKADHVTGQMMSVGLTLAESQLLSFEMRLSLSSLTNLIQMTPNQRHLHGSVAVLLEPLQTPISVTASFQLLAFKPM